MVYMENIFEMILLGFVQGFTEFLPISSSGHLMIVPQFFDFSDQSLPFIASLHLGTLLAVILYFWRDWMDIFLLAFGKKTKFGGEKKGYKEKTLWILAVATLPGAFFGFLFLDFFETNIPSASIMALFIIIGSIVLWQADRKFRGDLAFENISFRKAFLVGCAQTLSLFPGISRSGITMATGLFLGLSRKDSARFSFLMAVPITIGASLFSLPEIFYQGLAIESVIAIIITFFIAYITISFFLGWIERVKYGIFVWYGFIFAGIVFFFAR
jgi:undecaprenyl-diphosphatase